MWKLLLDDNDHVLSVDNREVRLLEDGRNLPALEEGSVQVFVLRSDDDAALLERAESLLSPLELERAARIRVEGARGEFIVGRAALRVLLGSVMECSPESVPLRLGAFGKPFVPDVHSSVSHSRGLIYIALCRTAGVGVDVEWVDPALEALEIAQANFAPEEIAHVAAEAEGEARARSFCQLWTRKEAVAKADGRGLQIPLQNIPATGADGSPTRILSSIVRDGSPIRDSDTFFVHTLPAPHSYVAALAVWGKDFPITVVPCCDMTNTREVYRSAQTRNRSSSKEHPWSKGNEPAGPRG